jgi:hypothetical protein
LAFFILVATFHSLIESFWKSFWKIFFGLILPATTFMLLFDGDAGRARIGMVFQLVLFGIIGLRFLVDPMLAERPPRSRQEIEHEDLTIY